MIAKTSAVGGPAVGAALTATRGIVVERSHTRVSREVDASEVARIYRHTYFQCVDGDQLDERRSARDRLPWRGGERTHDAVARSADRESDIRQQRTVGDVACARLGDREVRARDVACRGCLLQQALARSMLGFELRKAIDACTRLDVSGDVDLLDIVEDAIDTLPASSRVRITCSGSSQMVRGDRSLLVTALVSGVENALKFSSGPVRVHVDQRGSRAFVVIDDEGPGVPLDDRERVFATFYRGSAHTMKGHGIGLAVIAHVMSLHGGLARFVDKPLGASLELSLPLGRAA